MYVDGLKGFGKLFKIAILAGKRYSLCISRVIQSELTSPGVGLVYQPSPMFVKLWES